MNDWLKLILSLSLSGSILALLLFAAKPFIRYRVSRTFQYYIWLLVFLRLVFPFSLESSLMNGLFFASNSGGNTSVHSDGTSSEDVVQSDTNQAYSKNPPSSVFTVQQKVEAGYYNNDTDHAAYLNDLLAQSILCIWLLGVLAALVYHISGYLTFLFRLKQANTPASAQESELLQMQIKTMFHKHKNVRLFRNPFSITPMLVGLFRPSIVIPDIPFTQVQLESILRHELTHLRRRDILLKWFAVIVTSLHWFNPLLLLVKREMNRACELSCDESVISGLDLEQRQAYGETLIAVVAERKYPVGVLSTTMCEEKRTLKERLTAIMNYGRGTKKTVLLSAILFAVLLVTGVVLGAGVGRDFSGGPAGKLEETSAGNADKGNASGSISIRAGNKAGAKTGTLLTGADYDLSGIAKHKTPYVGNHSKDLSLVASLPLPDTFFIQQYISLKTKEEPYGLTAYYEAAGNDAYPGVWPVLTTGSMLEVNSKLNALVLFTMIDNVSDITFAYRETKSANGLEQDTYDTVFSFSRKEIEDDVGSLSALSEDPERLAAVIGDAAAKWAVDIANPESHDQIETKIGSASAQTGAAGMPEYSDEEVASARAVVEKFYRAIEKKDADAVLATLYMKEGLIPEKAKDGYALSFDRVNRTLVSITYDSQDQMRKTYRPGNLKITADNIIVFRTSFDIHYLGNDEGAWNEGRYNNWAMILIRDNAKSPWLIYDQGY